MGFLPAHAGRELGRRGQPGPSSLGAGHSHHQLGARPPGQQRHGSTVASCPAHFQLSLLLETSRGHPTFGPNQPKTPTFSKSSLPQTSPRHQTHKQGRPLALLCLFCPSFQLSPSDRSLMSPRMSPLTEGQCRIIQVLAPLPPGSSPPCPSARSTRPRGMLCPEIKSQKFQKSNSRNYRNPAS